MVILREAQLRYDMAQGLLTGLSDAQQDLIISQAKYLDRVSPNFPTPEIPYSSPVDSKLSPSSRLTNTIATFGAAMI